MSEDNAPHWSAERAGRVARAHGHDVKTDADGRAILVGIECVGPDGVVVIEWDRAASWSQLRDVLGY